MWSFQRSQQVILRNRIFRLDEHHVTRRKSQDPYLLAYFSSKGMLEALLSFAHENDIRRAEEGGPAKNAAGERLSDRAEGLPKVGSLLPSRNACPEGDRRCRSEGMTRSPPSRSDSDFGGDLRQSVTPFLDVQPVRRRSYRALHPTRGSCKLPVIVRNIAFGLGNCHLCSGFSF